MQILKPYRIELAETLTDHWYNVFLGKKKIGTFPSSTTILHAYPQSEFLTKWIADNGWQESQSIKSAAGERGTMVHKAIEALLNGTQLWKGGMVPGMTRTISVEEWFKLTTFVDFYHECRPKLIANELPVFSKKYGYCGRTDYICEIDGKIVLMDFKTSNHLHRSFPLQFASYANAVEEITDLKIDCTGVLQLGTQRNRKGYRFELYGDWRDHFKTFLSVKNTWEYEFNTDSKGFKKEPAVLELPATLKLNPVEPVVAANNQPILQP